jgi:hypothetical protein
VQWEAEYRGCKINLEPEQDGGWRILIALIRPDLLISRPNWYRAQVTKEEDALFVAKRLVDQLVKPE